MMRILSQLSSQRRDRSEYSNRKVVLQCLEDPALLEEIAVGLESRNAALAGDCAEVMTMIARDHPDWIAPYADALSALLGHKSNRARWEAVHALSYLAALVPEKIRPLLPILRERIREDASVIARDYAVDTVANYAGTGPSAAEEAYPILVEALTVWDEKQAHHALAGLVHVARLVPRHAGELRAIAAEYARSARSVVRKAAKDLVKEIGN